MAEVAGFKYFRGAIFRKKNYLSQNDPAHVSLDNLAIAGVDPRFFYPRRIQVFESWSTTRRRRVLAAAQVRPR